MSKAGPSSLCYYDLLTAQTCLFCEQGFYELDRVDRKVHYLWKHPIHYVTIKRRSKESLESAESESGSEVMDLGDTDIESESATAPDTSSPDYAAPPVQQSKLALPDFAKIQETLHAEGADQILDLCFTDGVRVICDWFREGDEKCRELIFKVVLPCVSLDSIRCLCLDHHGNKIIASILTFGCASQRTEIRKLLADHILSLSTDPIGSMVVCDLIECTEGKECCRLLHPFRGTLLHLSCHEQASLVVQTVFKRLGKDTDCSASAKEMLQHFLDELRISPQYEGASKLIRDQNGHKVLMAIHSKVPEELRQPMVDQLLLLGQNFAFDPHGSLVLADWIQRGSEAERRHIRTSILGPCFHRLMTSPWGSRLFLGLLDSGSLDDKKFFFETVVSQLKSSNGTQLLKNEHSRTVFAYWCKNCRSPNFARLLKSLISTN